jgi:hypothetical protein
VLSYGFQAGGALERAANEFPLLLAEAIRSIVAHGAATG